MRLPFGTHHIQASEIPRGIAPTSIQGNLGPHLVSVLSLSHPMNGSFIASQIFININIEPAIKAGKPAYPIKKGNK